jgi:hypothetical protein
MRRKEDHLPRGVRWAVWGLGACGHLFLVPACIFAPFVLVICAFLAVGSMVNPWQADLIMCVPCFGSLMGKGMVLVSQSIEAAHCHGERSFDSKAAWTEVKELGCYEAAVICFVGALTAGLQLVFSPMAASLKPGLWVVMGLHACIALMAGCLPRWLAVHSSKG